MPELFSAERSTAKPQPTEYPVRDIHGHIVARHERIPQPNGGKRFIWRQPDGKLGLAGQRPRDLLYGAERLSTLTIRAMLVMTEGEGACDALHRKGVAAVGTVTGARGTPSDDVLGLLVPYRVRLWPDNDQPGRDHMARIAARLVALGCLDVAVVEWPGAPDAGDAANYQDDPRVLIDAARPVSRPAATNRRTPIVTYLHTVAAEQVDWLWQARFARGKYTLIAGEPGIGKTHLMTDATARITRIGRWPDGTPAPTGRVLWLTAEDGLADTLRPRIEGAGGDPSQVAALEAVREPDGTRTAVSLVRDLDILAAAICEVQPVLVIVDPITAYLGQVDTYRDSEVRSALAPLIDLIAQRRCALVAIGHLTKDTQRAALHRPGGSVAFVAAARLVLALASDPMNADRRLLAPLKSNICKPAPVLAYRIGDSGLTWEADPVSDIDVEAMLRPATTSERESRSDAEDVVRELLSQAALWPMDATDALKAGLAHGIPERTFQAAAKRLGVVVGRDGFGKGGKWLWYSSADSRNRIDAATPKVLHVAPMAPMVTLEQFETDNDIDATKRASPRAREKEIF
jgi:hypothetical protein